MQKKKKKRQNSDELLMTQKCLFNQEYLKAIFAPNPKSSVSALKICLSVSVSTRFNLKLILFGRLEHFKPLFSLDTTFCDTVWDN